MKRIQIVCVGKLSKQFCRDGCAEYLKRLKSFYDVTTIELSEQPTVKKECDEIEKRLSGYVVLMDVGGATVSSEELAELVKTEHERHDEITFVIGGASGVDDRIRSLAQKRISFGRVTYPHQIARMLLCEQLYRVGTILKGVPYHK